MSSHSLRLSALLRRPAFVWLIVGACGVLLLAAIIESTPAWTINEAGVILNRAVSHSGSSGKGGQQVLARLEAALVRDAPGTASFWRTYSAVAAWQPGERAFDLLQSAQKQGLLDRTGQLWYGEVASETGHWQEAAQALAGVDAAAFLVDRAEKTIAQGDHAGATNWYLLAADNVRRAITRDASAPTVASTGGNEESTGGIDELLDGAPGSRAVALLRIGSGLVGLGLSKDAIPSLELALSEMRTDPPGTRECQSIQFTLAMSLAQTMPDESQAAQAQDSRLRTLVEQALSLDHTAAAYLQAGRVLRQLGARAEALDHLRAAIGLDPKTADAYLTMGAMLSEDGLPCLARDLYASGARVLPGNGPLIGAYAKAAYQTMAPQDAIPLLEKAVELDPGDPYVYAFLGDCRLDLGDVAAARGAYLEGVRRFPGSNIFSDRLCQPSLRPSGMTL